MSKTCLLIPCYNEEKRLNIEEFLTFLKRNESVDLLFVNDGSVDKTVEVVNSIQHDRAKLLDLKDNGGKANAIREGIKHIKDLDYDLCGYFDADLSTDLNEVERIIKPLENSDTILSMGSRHRRLGTNINRHLYRHILGRIYATIVSMILKLPVYDTQCGAKIFKKKAFFAFDNPFVSRWFFDVEIIARINKLYPYSHGSQSIVEVPLLGWRDIDGSKLTFMDFLTTPLELLKIYRKYK